MTKYIDIYSYIGGCRPRKKKKQKKNTRAFFDC